MAGAFSVTLRSQAAFQADLCPWRGKKAGKEVQSSPRGFGLRQASLADRLASHKSQALTGSCLELKYVQPFKIKKTCLPIRLTLVDDKPRLSQKTSVPAGVLAYELMQGALVRQSVFKERPVPEPPTAVLLHGILGGRKNWGSFARRLAKDFPMWQFLLVDLRCHGDSASISKRVPHSVASAARDVLQLVGQLRLTPRVLIGHSFGGKVALSMADQAAKPLARPVRVWVLDATPGKVHAGGDGEDHPAELIYVLRQMPKQVPSKGYVIDALIQKGFSMEIAQWVTTNLQPVNGYGRGISGYSWVFDLEGIAEMYKSYENTNLWQVVENVPQGVHVDFLRAERSLHRWAHEDIQRIHAAEELAASEGAGVQMHVLEDAGHWVHADNPDGLFRILASSFERYNR
uniref:TSA: Wollemia nobilis Ref_Wollemi_Transcript_5885_1661 transcribed RNA sequence n=1 Tax=Wollemia nobilis TaxID=56998 RepID=A0A0C9QVG4_9CONI